MVPSPSKIVGEAAVGVGAGGRGVEAGAVVVEPDVDGVPFIVPKGDDVAGPPLEPSKGVGSCVSRLEGELTILLDVGDEGCPFDVGPPLDDGVVEGALTILLDVGDEGCPFEVGPPFDEGVVEGAPTILLDVGDEG
jgi:hypothetical protein